MRAARGSPLLPLPLPWKSVGSDTGCEMRDGHRGMRDAGCELAGCGMRDAGCVQIAHGRKNAGVSRGRAQAKFGGASKLQRADALPVRRYPPYAVASLTLR